MTRLQLFGLSLVAAGLIGLIGLFSRTPPHDVRVYDVTVVDVEFSRAGTRSSYDYTLVLCDDGLRIPIVGIHPIPNGKLKLTVDFTADTVTYEH